MHLKPDVSEIKKMTVKERKIEGMRQIKAAFEQAAAAGNLTLRPACQ